MLTCCRYIGRLLIPLSSVDRHPRESGGPGRATKRLLWIPAFAGMTVEQTLSWLVASAQKLQHPFHHLALGIDRRHGAGARERVAREKALVEHLAAAEGAAGGVPRQAEEFDPVPCRGVVGRQILLDRRRHRALEIRLARGQQKAAR